jgi:three-Cys-motif partner protein
MSAMHLEERNIQTKVKHLILSDYMRAWSSIILSGLSTTARTRLAQGLPFRSRLVYVDGFSYKGRYSRDVGQLPNEPATTGPIWGSPILGVQALDRAEEWARARYQFDIETAAILVEQDTETFRDLLENLRSAGFSDRVVENPTSISPRDGEIVVLRDDFRDRYPEVVDLLRSQYTKSFVLLDPRGVAGIPYEMVRQFVSLPSSDAMINWPYLNLQRSEGRSNEAIQSSLDEMFGDSGWRALARDRGAESVEDREARLARFYRDRLQLADRDSVIKYTRLDFPDRDRAMFYLFLTTHDPTGALTLNEVLDDARLAQIRMRWNLAQDKYVRRQEAAGQQHLFETASLRPPAPTPESRVVDIGKLSAEIFDNCGGMPVSRKDIYRSFADSEVYVSEINRALTQLKREGRAGFGSTTKFRDPIRFAPKGGTS